MKTSHVYWYTEQILCKRLFNEVNSFKQKRRLNINEFPNQ